MDHDRGLFAVVSSKGCEEVRHKRERSSKGQDEEPEEGGPVGELPKTHRDATEGV